MLKNINQRLAATPRGKLFFLGLLLISITGIIDHITGYEISFAIFYVGPIALSWYCGLSLGMLLSLISIAVWLVVDFTAGHQYAYIWIPLWNALTRLAFFLFTVLVLAKIKHNVSQEELLARTDALTELGNARYFREQSALLFHIASRQEQPLALAYIDLDNFKSINDQFGHETGDRVLKQVGQILASALRGSDIAGRLGGDEFAILLTGTGIDGAETYFIRLQQRLLEKMADHGWPVGFSIGVAVFTEPLPEGENPLQMADDLMYQVKRQGKNQVLCKEIKAAIPARQAAE